VTPTDGHDKIATKQAARPIRRLIAPLFVMVFGFCAVCAYVLIEARNATWERAAEVATSLAAAVEAEVSRNIENVDLSLQAVVDNMQRPDIDVISPDFRQLVVFDRSATARGARYGGDEFAVLLARTTAEGAERVAELIRHAFAAHCERDRIVISGLKMGVACLTPATGESFAELVQPADVALYRAKNLGRGRTETARKVKNGSAAEPQSDRDEAA
jgi:predicted signal transduction protein with EAL and GGDEF domain